MNERPKSGQSWWRTLPGVLTATATLITAITGLIVGLNQVGLFDRDPDMPLDTAAVQADQEVGRSSQSADHDSPDPTAGDASDASPADAHRGGEGGRLTTASGAVDFDRHREYWDGETEQAQFDCYWNLPVTFHSGSREFYYGDCSDFAVVRQIEFYRPQ